MANGTVLNPGSGGDTIQNVDNTAYKTPVSALTNSAGTSFVALKPASTAAVVTDVALVVAISPNNTVATTQSGTWNVGLSAGSNLVGKVGIDQTTPGTTNAVAVTHVGSTAIVTGGVDGSQGVGGVTAVNATSTGNPVFAGGVAVVGANPTKATNSQRTGIATDAAGRLITVASHERTMSGTQQTTITSSTAETTVLAAVASTFLDITGLQITNSSTSATLVTLKDSTAGTTRKIFNIAAGGGIVVPFNPPLAQATVNTNWTITCGTPVASISVNIDYVKNT